jgi:pentatricopeptide repeat protein
VQLWRQHQLNQPASIELYTTLLSAYAKVGPTALEDGIQVYSKVTSSMKPDPQFYAALVNMYTKCGQHHTALSIWETLRNQNNGHSKFLPLVISVLTACANSASEAAFHIGHAIHAEDSVKDQLDSTSVLVYYTALINMYTKCAHPEKAVAVYNEMQQRQVRPGLVTYICLFTACGAVGPSALAVSRQLYQGIQCDGIITDTSLENSLLSMLVKCGEPLETLARWKTLQTSSSFIATTVTYICALAACADIGPTAISSGTEIHALLTSSELQQENVMAALLNMYARCGQPLKSLELWKTFVASLHDGIVTSPALFTAIFTACAALCTPEALAVGSGAREMMGSSVQNNIITTTTLMQMYTQCGDPEAAISLWKHISREIRPTSVTYQ